MRAGWVMWCLLSFYCRDDHIASMSEAFRTAHQHGCGRRALMNVTQVGGLDLIEFVRDLQKRRTLHSEVILSELIAGAVRLLPPAEHAGITAYHDGKISTRSSTGAFVTKLDQIQDQCGAGPCVWAAKHYDVVRVDDVEHDTRWPEYSRVAVELTPVRSVLSVVVAAEAPGRSVLNIYAEKPHAFDAALTETTRTYAAYAAMVWTMARRDEQFRQALNSRDIIGQAKGIIMERLKIDAKQAFQLLKRLSQSSNTPLAKVAVRLVEAEQHQPRRPHALR